MVGGAAGAHLIATVLKRGPRAIASPATT